MESYIKFQKEKPKVIVQLGDEIKEVELHAPLCLIIGDGKSDDMVAGRKATKSNRPRLLPSCTVHCWNSDNPDYECVYLDAQECQQVIDALSYDTGKWKIPSAATKKVDKPFCDALEALQLLSGHRVNNAFRDVCFGGDPRGVFGAITIDVMHALEEGLIKYVCKILMALFTDGVKGTLDEIVDNVIANSKSTCRKWFPRVNFTHGFTNLTLLSATEWVGIAFTFLLLLQTDQARCFLQDKGFAFGTDALEDFFGDDMEERQPINNEENYREHRFFQHTPECSQKCNCNDNAPEDPLPVTEADDNTLSVDEEDDEDEDNSDDDDEDGDDDDEDGDSADDDGDAIAQSQDDETSKKKKKNELPPPHGCTIAQMTRLLEALLTFHAWLKSTDPFPINPDAVSKYRKAIRNLMVMIKHICPRQKGNGWRLPKFHTLLHAVDDLRRFGAFLNYHAGIGECGLRQWIKKPAKNAQMFCSDKFQRSMARRLQENMMIGRACRVNCIELRGESAYTPEAEKKPSAVDAHLQRILQEEEEALAEELENANPGRIPLFKGKPKFTITLKKKPHPHRNKYFVQSSCLLAGPRRGRLPEIHPLVLSALAEQWAPKHFPHAIQSVESDNTLVLDVYTECMFNNYMYRTHPNYKSNGPWHDWASVHFEENGGGKFPCKILCFFKQRNSTDTACYALVHGCGQQIVNPDGVKSHLTETWKREFVEGTRKPRCHVVPADSLSHPELVIENTPGLRELFGVEHSTTVIVAKDRSKFWREVFFEICNV